MSGLKDKITSVATGDAYDKPAKTDAGAFTTQDSNNAHTTQGTSADPNSTGNAVTDKMNQGMEAVENKAGVPDNQKVNSGVSNEVSKEL